MEGDRSMLIEEGTRREWRGDRVDGTFLEILDCSKAGRSHWSHSTSTLRK